MKEWIIWIIGSFPTTYFSDSLVGIIVFTGIITLALIVCVPGWFVCLTTSIFFGFIPAFFIQTIALIFSEIFVYVAGRIGKKICGNELSKNRNYVLGEGSLFYGLLLLKINPLIPFIPVVFFCGIKKVSLLILLLASLAGGIPLEILWLLLGTNIKKLTDLTDISVSQLFSNNETCWILFNIFSLLALISFLFYIRKRLIRNTCLSKNNGENNF